MAADKNYLPLVGAVEDTRDKTEKNGAGVLSPDRSCTLSQDGLVLYICYTFEGNFISKILAGFVGQSLKNFQK